MTRLRADLLLLFAACIWGTTFVAQKMGMEGLGPFGFVGVRFVMSLLVILPFVIVEARRANNLVISRSNWGMMAVMAVMLTAGVIMQQAGIFYTSVTNAGFLTGVGVVLVPFIGWGLFRKRPQIAVWPACILALAGVWFLNGAALSSFGLGECLVLGCAATFAVQVVLMSVVAKGTQRPFLISFVQYALCAVVGLAVGFGVEGLNMEAVRINFWPLFYAGVISGGIGYTLQAVVQQYTPSADAAIIMSGEALFAALAGAMVLGERLDWMGWLGCGLILGAMLLVEAGVLLFSKAETESLDAPRGVL